MNRRIPMNQIKIHYLLLAAFAMAGCATTQAAGVKNDSQTIALEQQAKSYENDGDYEASTEVYKQLIAMHPNDFRSVSWQQSIMSNAEALSDPYHIVDESRLTLQRLVQARDEKFDGATPEAIAETQKKLTAHLNEEAQGYYTIYQKFGNPVHGATAHDLYGLLTEYFPDSDDTCESLYQHAALEYEGGHLIVGADAAESHYETAAREYDRVVERCAGILDSSKIVDAAHGSMLAYGNLLDDPETCPGIPQTPEAKEGEEQVYPEFPIAECRLKFIDAAKQYFNIVQKYDPNNHTFAYHAMAEIGLIYFDHNQFENAIPFFREITEAPESTNEDVNEARIYAADHILECYKLLKHYKNMLDAIHAFRSDNRITSYKGWITQEFIKKMDTYEEAIAKYFKEKGESN